MRKGAFITLEGIEGAGKSTQARRLGDALRAEGRGVVLTVEPGGTEIGREIRAVLLNPAHDMMDAITELMLYAAARRQHLEELIRPALAHGEVVICDRFSDSTMAYQGYARGLDMALIAQIDQIATGGLKPDLTILLDMAPEAGIDRNRMAGKHDRFEAEPMEFHVKVRQGFLNLMRAEPGRIKSVAAASDTDTVGADILALVNEVLGGR